MNVQLQAAEQLAGASPSPKQFRHLLEAVHLDKGELANQPGEAPERSDLNSNHERFKNEAAGPAETNQRDFTFIRQAEQHECNAIVKESDAGSVESDGR